MGQTNGYLKLPTPWGNVEITGSFVIWLTVMVLVFFSGVAFLDRSHQDLGVMLKSMSLQIERTNGLQYATCMSVAQDNDTRERCTRMFNREIR
jgi:hypothetical protein